MKNIIVIDHFYKNPEAVRQFALQCDYLSAEQLETGFAGTESKQCFYSDDVVKKIEQLIGKKIKVDPKNTSFGVFNLTYNRDQPKVRVHTDHTDWTALVYLSQSNVSSGTEFFQHKKTHRLGPHLKRVGKDNQDPNHRDHIYYLDGQNPQAWQTSAYVGAQFNRLVLFKSGYLFHAAKNYFGNDLNDARLIQLFFFDECKEGF